MECWNSLDGKTVELSSWVQGSDSTQIANNAGILNEPFLKNWLIRFSFPDKAEFNSGISIEKLENQLIQLKATFSEKEKMLENLKTRYYLKGKKLQKHLLSAPLHQVIVTIIGIF